MDLQVNIDTAYDDATPEELASLGTETCSICFGEFEEAKKLPCNHYFHKACLRQWLERLEVSKMSCPVCRQPVGREQEVHDDSVDATMDQTRVSPITNMGGRL